MTNICEVVNTYEILEHIMGIKGLHPHRLATVDAMRKKIADHVANNMKYSQGVVLDIGCGTGHGTLDLARMLGNKFHVIGIDIKKDAIESARQIQNAKNVSFFHGDLSNFLSVHNNHNIVGVISISVSMFIPNVLDFYRKIFDALIPGGIFIDAPFTFQECAHEIPDNIKSRTYEMCGCNMKMYKVSELKSTLKESGFHNIESASHKFDLMNMSFLIKDYPLKYLLGNFLKNVIKPPIKLNSVSSKYLFKRTINIFWYFLINKNLYAGGELIVIKTTE